MAATISGDYLRLQQDLHRNPDYGIASLHDATLDVATVPMRQ